MIMSSCLLPPYGVASLSKPISLKKKKFGALQARAQSFRNEGRPGNNNMVDANKSILREKIEEVKMKERLERYCRREIGWNNHNYCKIIKRDHEAAEGLWHELVELVGIVGGTVGITIVSCTAFLFLFSFLVHLYS
ncbi:hypothetical protein HS088_TW03G00305 [Tripterygium wilfordii]|uniref:Uncharacterized protein n=1 Tax=Tripterygium wilfordii TaxID=458696 RepID=A0A7J7DUI4_TRIWF|nr:uncharacterized protein LOC119995329 [Tripterygium wilfordii]KAF5749977.1 hypothetical protein HS088_TW03G00305 [Tripterygium wilfordii]